jgi:hypothetical protein
MVDERIKNLIPCIKNQVSQSFEVSVFDEKTQLKHEGIACNGCSMNPIIGIRYKCIECPNFNFCSSCEEKIEHQKCNHKFSQFSNNCGENLHKETELFSVSNVLE